MPSAATPISPGQERCIQCWRIKDWPSAFLGANGTPIKTCQSCRAKYRNWQSKSLMERAATMRKNSAERIPRGVTLRAKLFFGGGNRKLGNIPSSITSRVSCPTSCGMYGAGCYAEFSFLGSHWRSVGAEGDSWKDFCREVSRLPQGQLWRHNVAGDLPGRARGIDRKNLRYLAAANYGRRGFTFTHRHSTRGSLDLIRWANRLGFTINLSAESLDGADQLADYGVGPVAVVLPSTTSDRALRTPAGRKVVVCPAQTKARLTCETCQLCAIPTRKAIVGFRSHGQAKALVDARVRLPMVRSRASAL